MGGVLATSSGLGLSGICTLLEKSLFCTPFLLHYLALRSKRVPRCDVAYLIHAFRSFLG